MNSSMPALARCWMRLIVIVAFVGVVSSGSGKGNSQSQQEKANALAIRIVDSKGRPVPNIAPTATSQTFDVAVGPIGASRSFVPDALNIFSGDTVRWTWDSGGHNVTSGASCNADNQFCSPTDTNCGANPLSNAGAVYSHTFGLAGAYSYYCAAHCGSGMIGTVNVSIAPLNVTSISRSGTGAIVVTGQTAPNLTVTIKGSADLVTFATIGTATANSSGIFSFPDTAPLIKRFYRATYP